MVKCKAKFIQTDLGTFWHNQAYPRIILAYPKPYVTLLSIELWYIQNPDIFKIRSIFTTLVYPEKHIQTLSISRALTYTKLETYSKPWYIQNTEIFKIRNIVRTLVYPEP